MIIHMVERTPGSMQSLSHDVLLPGTSWNGSNVPHGIPAPFRSSSSALTQARPVPGEVVATARRYGVPTTAMWASGPSTWSAPGPRHARDGRHWPRLQASNGICCHQLTSSPCRRRPECGGSSTPGLARIHRRRKHGRWRSAGHGDADNHQRRPGRLEGDTC